MSSCPLREGAADRCGRIHRTRRARPRRRQPGTRSSASTVRATRPTTSPTSTGSARRPTVVTRSCIWPPRSAWESILAISTATRGTTTSAPRSCSGWRRKPESGGWCSPRRWWSTARARTPVPGTARCDRPPRAAADLDAGRFEPRCPRCGRALVAGLVAEDAPLDPRNAYAATKVHGEHLGAVWARETGGVFAALRFHNVYGPGMPPDTPYAGVAAIFASSLRRGESPQVFEDGRQRRNFVHVDDVARAVVAALTADLPAAQLTPVNIGSPWITTVGELAERLSAGARRTRSDDHRPLPARRRPARHRGLPRRREPARLARPDPVGRRPRRSSSVRNNPADPRRD